MIRKFCDRCGSEILEKIEKKQTIGELLCKTVTEIGLKFSFAINGNKPKELPEFKISTPDGVPLILCEQCDHALRKFMTEMSEPENLTEKSNDLVVK